MTDEQSIIEYINENIFIIVREIHLIFTLRGFAISSSMDVAINLWISAVCSKSLAMKCQALETVPTFSLEALNNFVANFETPLE